MLSKTIHGFGSIPIHPITGWHSLSPVLLYPHIRQITLQFSYPYGRYMGLPCFTPVPGMG
ncbi:hypothetical protein HMPREF9446_00311 [Bacteroides fluxus YIT 12057]|uniref:Uncharacterized protein n=1 Tax=Bacteroides fluxus YIT 12057 TaxID=763034 RepID=F3PNM3_9BACE|nr:hypothetical protein HMPREF9446_00311 [Bacteroides fluxus YIT 12057]